MVDAYRSILYHQKLIDEWNDPKDIAQRAAVIIRKIHEYYGRDAYAVLKILEKQNPKCKHPKKMRDLCADGTVYCMDCNADLLESDIMSAQTPTLMKEKITKRRELVKKLVKKKLSQREISVKLAVSLSTIEKDIGVLRV